MMKRRRFLTSLAPSMGFVLAGALLAQQENGSITGSVTDNKDDDSIAGAQVIVTDQKTKEVREAQTSKHGFYAVKDLPPGIYRVQVKAAGYKDFSVKDVPVQKGEATYVDAVLKK